MSTFNDPGIEAALKDLYSLLYDNNHKGDTRYDNNYTITLYNNDKEVSQLCRSQCTFV